MEDSISSRIGSSLIAPTEGLLNAEQVAQYLNVSQSYIRKAVARNTIPFVRIGTRTLFRRSDLDTWVAEHIVPTQYNVQDRAKTLAATAMLREGRRAA